MRNDQLPQDFINADNLYLFGKYLVDNPIMFMGLSLSGFIMALCLYLNKEGK